MPLPGYAGESVDIALVADNLVEMLRAVGNDATLTLELTDGNKPAVFRSGDDFVYLVMPLAG
jgi:DNA polymerase-3 subunit beta